MTFLAQWREITTATLNISNHKLVEETKITLVGASIANGIQKVSLMSENNVLYSENVNGAKNYSKVLQLKDLNQTAFAKLNFDDVPIKLIVESTTNHSETTTVTVKNYMIGNITALHKLAQIVNSGNSLEGETIKIISDLDAKNQSLTSIGVSDTTRFNGTMDGQFHTIKNLLLGNSLGLFGILGEKAVVRSLLFENVNTQLNSTNQAIGVVVSRNYGTIQEIGIVSGELKSAGLNRLSIGGIAAVNYGTIQGSYSKANISASSIEIIHMGRYLWS